MLSVSFWGSFPKGRGGEAEGASAGVVGGTMHHRESIRSFGGVVFTSYFWCNRVPF